MPDSIFSVDLPASLLTTQQETDEEQKIIKKEIENHVINRQRAWL
jgi:hypothetical protein